MSKRLTMTLTLAAVVSVGACANKRAADILGAEEGASYGTVRSVEMVDRKDGGIGAGAVIGGVLGGVAGHQVGDGKGQKAATAAGAIGGAVIGHQIEKRQRNDAFQYTVQMDNGELRTFTYTNDQNLRPGERVRLADGVLQRY